jgi:hypothetical protein
MREGGKKMEVEGGTRGTERGREEGSRVWEGIKAGSRGREAVA